MYNDRAEWVSLYVFGSGAGTTDELIEISVKDATARRGKEVGPTEVLRGERGAPYLSGDGMPFVSVSHSGKFTVCAVSDGRVGVDLQITSPYRGETEDEQAERLLRLARRFFHPSETEWIEKDPRGRFFAVWSAKEAYVKYTGSGIDDTFGMTGVIPKTGLYGTEWEHGGVYYRLMPFAEGYSLCVCCEGPSAAEMIFADEY